MSGIVRPKILTAFEVPAGGWDFDFVISAVTSLDTPLTATVDAGEYFVAWDHQSDDLLRILARRIRGAISAAGLGTDRGVGITIDDDNKVRIRFIGTNFQGATLNDVQITWSTSHVDLVKALGSDGTDWTSTTDDEPQWTAEYQHAYGWYASEDHNLEELLRHDHNIASVAQTTAIDGTTKTVLWGSRYVNSLSLQMLKAVDTWSDGVGYGTAAKYGFERNRGLECWWYLARGGTRFRVYRNDKKTFDAVGAVAAAYNDTANDGYVTDADAAFTPQIYIGMHVLCEHIAYSGQVRRFHIEDNDATIVYSAQDTLDGYAWASASDAPFYIHDSRYQTYVLDTNRMSSWEPSEVPGIDRYDITIPLKRYVA